MGLPWAFTLMARHRRAIVGLQWLVVLSYAVLVRVPAFLRLPDEHAHVWDDFARFAQFMFWGIWWPFVMVSVMTLGRVWCGVFCPEGTLTEAATRRRRSMDRPAIRSPDPAVHR